MKKIVKAMDFRVLQKKQSGLPIVLRSVGDDATSYQGNQQRYVIAIPPRIEVPIKPLGY